MGMGSALGVPEMHGHSCLCGSQAILLRTKGNDTRGETLTHLDMAVFALQTAPAGLGVASAHFTHFLGGGWS